MCTKGCVAMILAGGRGERLGSLTSHYSKPAVYFGSNHRIIDFTINNCRHAGINTIGILSQYYSTDLHTYINTVNGDNKEEDDIYILPSQSDEALYTGTADAVYKNIGFVDRFEPENVLVLAGDHIYDMDYNDIITYHKETGADVTVAATLVPKKDASRFGILNANDTGRVYSFEEKPQFPKSNLASMGIYVFKWSALKEYLLADSGNVRSQHDFGKNILPRMLYNCESVYAYTFNGYWRDVGTVDSLWEANMDQIDSQQFGERDVCDMPYHVSGQAAISESIVPEGCWVFGGIRHSVLGDSVTICGGAEVVNSVIMPNVYIGCNVKIHNAIIGMGTVIMDNTIIGTDTGTDFFIDRKVCSGGISLVSPMLHIGGGIRFQRNSHIYKERLNEWGSGADITGPTYRLIESSHPSRRRQYASLTAH